MDTKSILFEEIWSHPNKLLEQHIDNMLLQSDDEPHRQIKIYYDIAKIKSNFQIYIRDTKNSNLDKQHSLLSAYIFLLNSSFDEITTAFCFLAIISHHGDVENFNELIGANKNFGKYFENSTNQFKYWDEVINGAKRLKFYSDIRADKNELFKKAENLRKYFLYIKKDFEYGDFIKFKDIFSSLVYSDKYEAIFNQKIQELSPIGTAQIQDYILDIERNNLNLKRKNFRNFVLNNFDENYKLFTLTAPTGYGKTLTALNYALKFNKERIIYALPFTSIIDQTYDIVSQIYKNNEILICKSHHKTTIDENTPEDRYSKLKFIMDSFSGEINITTLYQLIFAIFGNKNRDNVKFNQLKNSVIIIDEAQAIPYKFKKDFIRLCEIISEKFNTIFIFMSATMPIIKSEKFKEISNLEYFQDQNRYAIKWLNIDNEAQLLQKIRQSAASKNTLVVVNTVKKAQELFSNLKDEFKCFCLNGYMYDRHKQAVIRLIKYAIGKNKNDPLANKILLISTQTIEAGVDLDFDVGFREVAPISSIIQTAGRINRNFEDTQGKLFVFPQISEFTKLIYGDLQDISKAMHEILRQKDINESEILDISNEYFKRINEQLEIFLLKQEMKELKFQAINEKIQEIMSDMYKQMIVVEPRSDFIRQFEDKIFEINNQKSDKFQRRDLFKNHIRKLSSFGVNITLKDLNKLMPNLREIKGLKDIFYLPYGSFCFYDKNYGLKKDENLDFEDGVFD